LNGSLRRQLGWPGLLTQEAEQCSIAVGEVGPSFRSPSVNYRFRANKLPGQAESAGGSLGSRGILGRESKQIGGGDSCWKQGLLARRQPTRLGEQWLRFFRLDLAKDFSAFANVLLAACLFHDWGKANQGMQDMLSGKRQGQLFRHEQALSTVPGMSVPLKVIKSEKSFDAVRR
jgi:hypothetical protein